MFIFFDIFSWYQVLGPFFFSNIKTHFASLAPFASVSYLFHSLFSVVSFLTFHLSAFLFFIFSLSWAAITPYTQFLHVRFIFYLSLMSVLPPPPYSLSHWSWNCNILSLTFLSCSLLPPFMPHLRLLLSLLFFPQFRLTIQRHHLQYSNLSPYSVRLPSSWQSLLLSLRFFSARHLPLLK